MPQIRQYIELPAEEWAVMKDTNQRMLKVMEHFADTRSPEYLTVEEFCTAIKHSRWKFDALNFDGKVKTIKRGRKYLIPVGEVKRFYDGEMD